MSPQPSNFQRSSYSLTAQALHWLIVVLMVVQFAIAWTMPDIGRNTVPERMINLHLSFGALILAVAALRLVSRIVTAPPAPIAGVARWQDFAARATHALLYALLFAVPVLGWINASWRGFPITVFGYLTLPPLVTARAAAPPGGFSWGWTGDIHTILSYVMIGVIALHVLAALHHHFILRDRTLMRMLPIRQ